MNLAFYNLDGKEMGKKELPDEIFNTKINPELIHWVAVSQAGNRRQSSAHTKDRSEVSGGGRKPWRQKGTGRARHGSTRSPLWKGGGVTFGPTNERNYKTKISKKMKRKALFMVLTAKAKENLLFLIDDFKIDKIKTTAMAKSLKNILPESKRTLVALPNRDKNIILSTRNINNVSVVQAKDLNVLDLLSVKYLVMPVGAVEVIKKTFLEE